VAYRLALDSPEVVSRLAVLDILPTYEYWARFDRTFGTKIYHWTFLAQPEPLPEMLIGKAAIPYLDWTIASWTKAGNLGAFDARALDHYRAFFSEPARLHATCEDYRAGATVDFDDDRRDVEAGRRIETPLLALWGSAGISSRAESPLEVWRRWASDAHGAGIDSGHFVAEENPSETLAHLLPFLKG
ncbi:MAG: alpha/beta hydrolase, partial [Hyphomicrobiales bacterium]|nr:alpha/beta hydrolase [Hyphomicrobiales bacterium]